MRTIELLEITINRILHLPHCWQIFDHRAIFPSVERENNQKGLNLVNMMGKEAIWTLTNWFWRSQNCLIFPYLKKGSDRFRSRLPDQKIYVTALIRFVYGPNKLPLLLTKAAWSIPYLRYPYGPDRILIRSTLLVIRIYCLLLPMPFVSIFASVWLCHNLFKPA